MKSVATPLSGPTTIQSIILADDDMDDHLIFEDALKQVAPATRLSTVKNGHELLSLLSNFAPDLIFLDLDMPGKNGLECLKEIRQNPQYQKLPVVVYSSTSRQNNISVAYEMGANLFFVKSADYQNLVSAIQAILAMDWSQPSLITAQFATEGIYRPFTIEKAGDLL